MAVFMIKLTYHNIRQLAHNRWLWSLLLIIWLFILSVSIVHTQQHVLTTDIQCQLCVSSFNHTPFIGTNPFHLTVNTQQQLVIDIPVFSLAKQPPTTFYNRGPPTVSY